MKLPSIETIMQIPCISREQAKEVRQILESNGSVLRKLNKINKVIEGFGVEYARAKEDNDDDYRINYGFDYINMGDSYTATVIYDYEKDRFAVTSWGDVVEKNPERFG